MDYLILQAEEKTLTVAHFGLSRRSTELIGAATIELNEERTMTNAIEQIAEKITASPRIVLCLSPSLFAQRLVSLPFNDLRKAREVLPSQLQGDIALSVEDLALQALPAGDRHFLALWARKSEIAQAISQFSDAGIEPQVVTSALFALSELPGISEDCAVSNGNIFAILKAGKLTYFRVSEDELNSEAIAATLTAVELSGIELPPYLYNLGTVEDGFIDIAKLPIPLKSPEVPTELGHIFKNDLTFRELAPLYAVARAAYSGTLPDFRQGELAWTAGDVKLRKKLILSGILALTVLLLLFVSKGLQYRSAAADLTSINRSIASLYHEIFPARAKAVDEISEIKGEIKKMSAVESSGNYLDILKKLSEAKGTTINGLYEAELEGHNLRIKGDARSAQGVNEFKASLLPLLDSSELGEVKSRPDGTVAFTLTGVIKGVTK